MPSRVHLSATTTMSSSDLLPRVPRCYANMDHALVHDERPQDSMITPRPHTNRKDIEHEANHLVAIPTYEEFPYDEKEQDAIEDQEKEPPLSAPNTPKESLFVSNDDPDIILIPVKDPNPFAYIFANTEEPVVDRPSSIRRQENHDAIDIGFLLAQLASPPASLPQSSPAVSPTSPCLDVSTSLSWRSSISSITTPHVTMDAASEEFDDAVFDYNGNDEYVSPVTMRILRLPFLRQKKVCRLLHDTPNPDDNSHEVLKMLECQELSEGIMLLHLAVWKHVCLSTPTFYVTNADIQTQFHWHCCGWTMNKELLCGHPDIHLIVQLVAQFLLVSDECDGANNDDKAPLSYEEFDKENIFRYEVDEYESEGSDFDIYEELSDIEVDETSEGGDYDHTEESDDEEASDIEGSELLEP